MKSSRFLFCFLETGLNMLPTGFEFPGSSLFTVLVSSWDFRLLANFRAFQEKKKKEKKPFLEPGEAVGQAGC